MPVINKDILSIEEGIIAHQVNMLGVMGKGLAHQVKEKFPDVYKSYKDYYRDAELGEIQSCKIHDKLYIVNCFAQEKINRRDVKFKNHTDYMALKECIKKLSELSKQTRLPLYLPYKIGCGLAGGNWEVVENIIERIAPNAILCNFTAKIK